VDGRDDSAFTRVFQRAMPGHDEKSMIRVILYLILIALIAFGAVWLAERPGEVAITWQGERLDT
jgi:uncharacterized membrane protein (DUF485 family)